MVSSQIFGVTVLRMQPNDPLSSTSQAKTETGALQAMKSNKQYLQYRSEIQAAIDHVTSDLHCLRDAFLLMHNLSVAFYPEKEYLSVLHQYK